MEFALEVVQKFANLVSDLGNKIDFDSAENGPPKVGVTPGKLQIVFGVHVWAYLVSPSIDYRLAEQGTATYHKSGGASSQGSARTSSRASGPRSTLRRPRLFRGPPRTRLRARAQRRLSQLRFQQLFSLDRPKLGS